MAPTSERTKTELLGRLNAKPNQFDTMAGGGKPLYTMEDIAGALAGIEYPIYVYARVKYCMDYTGIPVLIDELLRKVRTIAHKSKWRGNGEYIDSMALMALEDAIKPNICRRCRGRGYLPSANKKMKAYTTPCDLCHGQVIRYPSATEAAKRCHPDMTREAWKKTWADRYRVICSELAWWDAEIESHMRYQLKE